MSDILERLQTRITLLRKYHQTRMTIAEISVLEGAADDLEAAVRYIQALESVEGGPEAAATADATTAQGARQARQAEPMTRAR